MLQCPKCNYDNELGRIFCHSCGAKLDLSQIKPPTEGAKLRRRVKQSLARTVRIVVELVIVAVLVLGIVLMCLVPDVPPHSPTNADLVAADAKHRELEKLAAGRKGGTVEVTEPVLNTYLKSLSFDRPTGKGIEVAMVALRATLKEDAVLVEFVGEIQFGGSFKKRLYLGYDCTPVIRDGQCRFEPNTAAIGKLPVPRAVLTTVPLVPNYFGRLFGNLADDKKQLLDPLTKITVTKDVVKFEKAAVQ
jgi:hypothetical protein